MLIAYQILVNIVVGWRAHKNRSLHQTYETPKRLGFVVDFAQDGRQQIAHALRVSIFVWKENAYLKMTYFLQLKYLFSVKNIYKSVWLDRMYEN